MTARIKNVRELTAGKNESVTSAKSVFAGSVDWLKQK